MRPESDVVRPIAAATVESATPESSAESPTEHVLAINLPVDGQDGVVLFQRREKRPSARYLLRELFD
jgi:hypothetical protein